MRVLGIDWGEARLGFAVSDETGTLASPYKVVANDGDALAAVIRAAAEVGAEEVVVGLPLTLAGDEGPAAGTVRAFARDLEGRVAIPVKLVDERLTTKAAEDKLRAAGMRSGKIKKTADAAAAALILQTYLDLRAPGETDESP